LSKLTRVVMRTAMAVALTAGATLGFATAAHADGGLTVTDVSCESGASTYICTADYAGGTGAVQIRWYLNGMHIIVGDNRAWVKSTCWAGQYKTMQVVVTDSTGASASGSTSFSCRSGPWQ
jgi:hypothetical protein